VSTAAGPAPLTRDEGRLLLRLARAAVAARLGGQPAPEPGVLPLRLHEPQGAFVTVLRRGTLRGCIGIVRADEPLWRTVLHCAVAAGFEDPRFAPLEAEEEPELAFEVSILWPPRIVNGPGGIRIGQDGAIVTLGPHQGLLLPQVASEHHWDAMRFLSETCRKAGLDGEAWTRGARIEAFEAQVFVEAPRGRAAGEPA
jgi:AmmeMemoRadiSam system protein A